MNMLSFKYARQILPSVESGDLMSLGRVLRRLIGDEGLTVLPGVPTSGEISVESYRVGPILRVDITLRAARLPVTDAAGSGSYGSLLLATFGQQAMVGIGCRQNYTSFSPDGTGVPNDAAFDIGIGSVAIAAAADGALGGATDDDIGGEIALTLSAGTAAGTLVGTVAKAFDGTTTPGTLNLNFSGTAATVDGSGYIDVTGTISAAFSLLGDD